jgi:very-short-patch-repair endonuclease
VNGNQPRVEVRSAVLAGSIPGREEAIASDDIRQQTLAMQGYNVLNYSNQMVPPTVLTGVLGESCSFGRKPQSRSLCS